MRRPWPIEQAKQIVVVDPGLVDVCGPRETGRQPRFSPINGFSIDDPI
jgi:hypothetical protein